jgi:hypothetical protein
MSESTIDLSAWPKDAESGRYLCTADRPMPKDAPGRWCHPDAKDDGIDHGDTYDVAACPHCGIEFKCYLPDY